MAKINEGNEITVKLLKLMTKEELAVKMGVSVFTIISWQRFNRNPKFSAICLLRKILKKEEKNK
jgi:DNA-binding transcriptional regulator YiaG